MAHPYGSKHQQRRALWAAEIARLGTITCGCGCGQPIHAGDPFDLGHGIAVTHGGDGADSRPEIPGHNRSHGAQLRNGKGAASEEWW